MDAIKLLTEQHRKLEGLMKTALEAREPNARRVGLVKVGDDLMKHVISEEDVFYPAVKAKNTEGILLESLEEHLSLKRLLADLLELDPGAETWEPKFKVLSEQTEHHHKEEEVNLFPKVSEAMDAKELNALAQKILATQQETQGEERPRSVVVGQTGQAATLE